MASVWPPWAGTSPWASWAQALPQDQQPKGLSPRDAGPRGSSSRPAVGRAVRAPSPPCHSASTRQPSMTMLWGSIRQHPPMCHCQSARPALTPGQSWQPEGIREEVLEAPGELLGGGRGLMGGTLEAARSCGRFCAAVQAPGRATLKAHRMDGNPASVVGELAVLISWALGNYLGGLREGALGAARSCGRFCAAVPAPGGATLKASSTDLASVIGEPAVLIS